MVFTVEDSTHAREEECVQFGHLRIVSLLLADDAVLLGIIRPGPSGGLQPDEEFKYLRILFASECKIEIETHISQIFCVEKGNSARR